MSVPWTPLVTDFPINLWVDILHATLSDDVASFVIDGANCQAVSVQ